MGNAIITAILILIVAAAVYGTVRRIPLNEALKNME